MITLKELERLHIIDCLKKNLFNRTITAEELGISIRTMRNKIIQYKSEGYLKVDKVLHQSSEDIVNEFFIYGMATNEERLRHADSMINRDYL